MDLTLFDILAAGLVIRLRTIVQATTGLGAELVVVPLLALRVCPPSVIFARLILSSFITDGGLIIFKVSALALIVKSVHEDRARVNSYILLRREQHPQ